MIGGDNDCLLFYFGENVKISAVDVDALVARVSPFDVLLLQNECSSGAEMIRRAKSAGALVVFNPAPRSANILHEYPFDLVDVLILNLREARDVYGQLRCAPADDNSDDDMDAEALVRGIFGHLDASLRVCLITLAEDGSVFVCSCACVTFLITCRV